MMLDLTRVRGICFDVDGTLSDTDDQMVDRVHRVLKPITRIFPQFNTHHAARRFVMGIETPGNYLYSIPDLLGIDDEIAFAVDQLTRLGGFRTKVKFWLIPGVKALLQALQGRYPLSIVSARDEKGTRRFLNQFELEPFFDGVVTAHTCLHTKPYPDPVIHAAGIMGILPEECLMVGDTTVDIRSAKKAGAQAIGVLCGFGEEKELRRAGADLLLSTTADLAALLGGGDTLLTEDVGSMAEYQTRSA